MLDPVLERVIHDMKRGSCVVYEIDDNLLSPDPESRYARMVSPDHVRRVEKCIRACRAVQCSTPALAAALADIHPEIAVLENQLDHVPDFQEKGNRRDGAVFP